MNLLQNNQLGINPLYLPVINPTLKHGVSTRIDLTLESKSTPIYSPGLINTYQKYQLPCSSRLLPSIREGGQVEQGSFKNQQVRGFPACRTGRNPLLEVPKI